MSIYDLPKSATKAELRAALGEAERRAVAMVRRLDPGPRDGSYMTERQFVAWHGRHQVYRAACGLLLNMDEAPVDAAREDAAQPEPEAAKASAGPHGGFTEWQVSHTCVYRRLYRLTVRVCAEGVFAGYVGDRYVDGWDDLEEAKAALRAYCEAELS